MSSTSGLLDLTVTLGYKASSLASGLLYLFFQPPGCPRPQGRFFGHKALASGLLYLFLFSLRAVLDLRVAFGPLGLFLL
jgi:hypothetical protein